MALDLVNLIEIRLFSLWVLGVFDGLENLFHS